MDDTEHENIQYWQLCCLPMAAMLTRRLAPLGSRVQVWRLVWLWLLTRGRWREAGSLAALCRQLLSEPPNPREARDFLEELGFCWISFEPSHFVRSLEAGSAPDPFLIFPEPVLELHEVHTSPSSMEFK